jgi:hypothetical protein
MKYIIVLISMISVLSIITCGDSGTPAPPENVTITAAGNGEHVELSWEDPSTGSPDHYIIYFMAVGETDYTAIDTVSTTVYTHNPYWETGDYQIAAVFGDQEERSEVLTTIPVHSDPITLAELNATGNAGYGWNISDDLSGASFSMHDTLNAAYVDFYMTNFNFGPFDFMNAAQACEILNDPGAQVSSGNWRTTWFSNPITNPQNSLPIFDNTLYFNWMDVTNTDTTYLAVYLDSEGYYALAKFCNFDNTNHTIEVETWFQSIVGLRLIAH